MREVLVNLELPQPFLGGNMDPPPTFVGVEPGNFEAGGEMISVQIYLYIYLSLFSDMAT